MPNCNHGDTNIYILPQPLPSMAGRGTRRPMGKVKEEKKERKNRKVDSTWAVLILSLGEEETKAFDLNEASPEVISYTVRNLL